MLFLLPVTAGCAPTDIKWSEEVKLHDGKVIQVKRRTELSPVGFPTAKRGNYRYHELCYAPMGVHWKSYPQYKPEAFDIFGDKAYVRVPLGGCTACMLHGFPATNSIYFVWSGQQWTKLEETQVPEGLRFNLLSSTHGDDDGSYDARGLVTLADKRKRDASIYYVMDRTSARGLNERRSLRDMCAKCKELARGPAGEALDPEEIRRRWARVASAQYGAPPDDPGLGAALGGRLPGPAAGHGAPAVTQVNGLGLTGGVPPLETLKGLNEGFTNL